VKRLAWKGVVKNSQEPQQQQQQQQEEEVARLVAEPPLHCLYLLQPRNSFVTKSINDKL
jgi:hypothetical protein